MTVKTLEETVGASSKYSAKVAGIFMFNLIIGVGSLAMPVAVAKAGLLAGFLCISVVCFVAFISVTFMVEVLSTANAWLKSSAGLVRPNGSKLGKCGPVSDVTGKPLEDYSLTRPKCSVSQVGLFDMDEKIEMGLMTEMFLGGAGSTVFYTIFCLYLYGDLAIYAVSVATTLEKLAGADHTLSYYTFLWGFSMIIGPFCFFNFQKTAILQYVTMVFRNVAMFLMIILSTIDIVNGDGVPQKDVILWDTAGVKELFGIIVFAFMCHHSVPSIIVPLGNKSKAFVMLTVDYIIILLFYCLLAGTAVLSKPEKSIAPLYTLNFEKYPIEPLAKFLSFYPVFTLSSNFPLICITLRNNLLNLFTVKTTRYAQELFSLVAFIPPIIIAHIIHDVRQLVVLTGSFAGLAIMFVIPAFLVLNSRAKLTQVFGSKWQEFHPHQSPFKSKFWIYLVLGFALFILILKIF